MVVRIFIQLMWHSEKTITTSSAGKRSPSKRLFPRNRQKGIKNKTDKILTGPLGLLA